MLDTSETPAPGRVGVVEAAFDVHASRRDFSILAERINGHPLAWFDNGSTTHKPQVVIDRLQRYHRSENANIHRAAHALRRARAGAPVDQCARAAEVIFQRGATEALKPVARSWGGQQAGAGDEIIVSHLEHRANIVPWQQLAASKGAILRVIPLDDSGQLDLDAWRKLLNHRTKNCRRYPRAERAWHRHAGQAGSVALADAAGARVRVDGAQAVSHLRVAVQDLDADFYVFSGHKVFGPAGIGVLWGKRELRGAIPNKFEAGTGNIADAVGLGAALACVRRIGIEQTGRHEPALLACAAAQLGDIAGVSLIGTAAHKASVVLFKVDCYTTKALGHALNEEGIAVPTGHHCAQPILRRFGVETTVRALPAFYNTFDQIDRLAIAVARLARQRTAG